VSGVREAYTHSGDAKDAINYGIHLSRAVVIAAALIMISVFGSFAYSHLSMIRPVGFGLAVGVLVDAFIVRLLIIPAAMSILGKSAWWIPKWLDKILPDVDVEGAKLERKQSFEI
jgi:putative drug exporter of the RND superfamily